MAKQIKLFPNKTSNHRSCKFEVKCGEAALLEAYGLPCDYAVCINRIVENYCECEYYEKQYCQLGEPAGLSDETCSAAIVMPGTYVAILCYQGCGEAPDIDEEWAVFAEVCQAHDNLQTLLAAANVGDK